ncbi:hypothetical protein ACFYOV_19005 [Streptomyces sp. NPDC005931]|uniref:hypothetical protein n=1 Tax=Streptomyces sp. NPDC005931 TaxID=3364737 RepID=UPI003676EB97
MTTFLVSAFLFLHGFVHLRVWLARPGGNEPDPRHSWALSRADGPGTRTVGAVAVGLAAVTAMLYFFAGIAATVHSGTWPVAAFLAACAGLLLKILWFNPWLSLGVLLDAGVLAAVLAQWPASMH